MKKQEWKLCGPNQISTVNTTQAREHRPRKNPSRIQITTARQCCSVKADSRTRAPRPTYDPLPYPQLLSNGHENGRG